LGTLYAVYKNSGIISFSFTCFIISYFFISLAGLKATRIRVRVGRHPSDLSFRTASPAEIPGESGA
jgi:hypothetical protein